jgi:hypothetical protein
MRGLATRRGIAEVGRLGFVVVLGVPRDRVGRDRRKLGFPHHGRDGTLTPTSRYWAGVSPEEP